MALHRLGERREGTPDGFRHPAHTDAAEESRLQCEQARHTASMARMEEHAGKVRLSRQKLPVVHSERLESVQHTGDTANRQRPSVVLCIIKN